MSVDNEQDPREQYADWRAPDTARDSKEMTPAELAEVQNIIQRLSGLSPEQRKAITEYLQTETGRTGKPEVSDVLPRAEKARVPKSEVHNVQDFERLFPNVKLQMRKKEALDDPESTLLKKLTRACERASDQLGQEKFRKLDISISGIGSEIDESFGRIRIGQYASEEEMFRGIVNNAEKALKYQ